MLVCKSNFQDAALANCRVANAEPSSSEGGTSQSGASDGKTGSVHEGGVRELAAVREAREQGLDEDGRSSLQGVRVQPYFVAGDMSSWLVPRHFLLHNNPMEFAAKLDDCPCFQDPEVHFSNPTACIDVKLHYPLLPHTIQWVCMTLHRSPVVRNLLLPIPKAFTGLGIASCTLMQPPVKAFTCSSQALCPGDYLVQALGQ